MITTEGYLLDRRIRYTQPKHGFRSGIEPVLLAASVPARPGEMVLEAGTGAGAMLLCLAARVANVTGVGIERDAALARLAQVNAEANGFGNLLFVAADIRFPVLSATFDHACANPPYHAQAGTASPSSERERAKRASEDMPRSWAHGLSRRLRPRGTLTFIIPAALLPPYLTALAEAGCGPDSVLPLWPKPGHRAKLLLVRGIKGSHASMRLLPGLVLHDSDGGYTAAADAVLRGGAALYMA